MNNNRYTMDHVASRLLKLRKELGLSQYEFAEQIGLREKTYVHYEKGRNTPPLNNMVTICNTFGVDVNYFLKGN